MLAQAGISDSRTQLEIVRLKTPLVARFLILTGTEHGPQCLVAGMRTDWLYTDREGGTQNDVFACLRTHYHLFVRLWRLNEL